MKRIVLSVVVIVALATATVAKANSAVSISSSASRRPKSGKASRASVKSTSIGRSR